MKYVEEDLQNRKQFETSIEKRCIKSSCYCFWKFENNSWENDMTETLLNQVREERRK